MTVELVDLGLRFTGESRDVAAVDLTDHYMGPSPWTGADRSTALRFMQTCDHNRCPTIVRGIHAYHLSLTWFGIAYTYAVCPHGVIYMARGPGRRTGANGTNHANRVSYAVVGLWGDDDPVTDPAKRAYHDAARRLGVPLGGPHQRWVSTSCSGPGLIAWGRHGYPLPDTSQEDDMPLTDHEKAEIAERTAQRVTAYLANPTTNPGTVIDPYARNALAAIHRSTSDPDHGIRAILLAQQPGGTIDVAGLAAQIVDQLDRTDAKAVADELARRLAS